jgi:hypothetical protein
VCEAGRFASIALVSSPVMRRMIGFASATFAPLRANWLGLGEPSHARSARFIVATMWVSHVASCWVTLVSVVSALCPCRHGALFWFREGCRGILLNRFASQRARFG